MRTATRPRDPPFEKGVSGSPRGRPNRNHDVAELARKHSADAIATIAAIMVDASFSPSTRVMAANALLDRGFDRPPQSFDLNHPTSLADEFENFHRMVSSRRGAESL